MFAIIRCTTSSRKALVTTPQSLMVATRNLDNSLGGEVAVVKKGQIQVTNQEVIIISQMYLQIADDNEETDRQS